MQPLPEIPLSGTFAWVLIGGIATRAYMPERKDLHVDIMIHVEDEQAARDMFIQAGYTVTGLLQSVASLCNERMILLLMYSTSVLLPD